MSEQSQTKRIVLGFQGNHCYIWDQTNGIQMLSVDTKGGNRPIRLILKSLNIGMSAYGRVF